MATAVVTTLPPSLRARVMQRAWELFRQHYGFPNTPFRSIGARCFASCLKMAWYEAKEIVRLASYGVERLTALRAEASHPHQRVGITTQFWEAPEKLLARLTAIRLYDAALGLAGAR